MPSCAAVSGRSLMRAAGEMEVAMSTSERLRKGATGVCLILAPLGILVGLILHPAESMDPAEQLGIIGSDADRWATAHYVIALSAVFLAGAVLGLAHLIHQRRPGQAIVGGALGVIGAMALCAVAFSEATFGAELGRVSTSGGALEAFKAVASAPAALVILIGALLGPVGSIVLGSGLLSSGVAPRWTAYALMLGGACLLIGLPINVPVLAILGAALQLLALAPIGAMVFSETNEEWTHPSARHVA